MTTPFEQAFPGFVLSCGDVFSLLLPWAMCLLVLAFPFQFWEPISPVNIIMFIVKLFLVIMLLAKSHDLINNGQALVQQLVEQKIPARPDRVATRYKEKLAQAQNAPAEQDQSFWDKLFSANWFESIIYAILTMISWLAMAVLFYIYSVQRAVLLLCWAISPLLIPLLAIPPLSSLGLRHLLRTIGVILWPLGLALAATFTDGLIDVATSQDLLASHSVVGSLGYGLQNLLAITVVAIWIVISSVMAPVFIQRLIVGSTGPATFITKGASLMTNIALPSYFGLPAAGRYVYRTGQVVVEAVSNLRQRLGLTSGTQKPTEDYFVASQKVKKKLCPDGKWQPGPDDPTGDKRARSIAEEAKRK